MKIQKQQPDYQVWELKVNREKGAVQLSWKFKQGSHFLVYIHDSRIEIGLSQILEELKKQKVPDAKIFAGSSLVYESTNGIDKLFCMREKEFLNKGKKFTLESRNFKQGIPYSIRVYMCNYNPDNETYFIYESSGEENVGFLPVNIQVDIKEKKRWFTTKKWCFIHVPWLEAYTDGAILYHVDGARCDFPLPGSCLGKELCVQVPRTASVSIRIADEYKKYYRKA